ncbi:Ferric/cupric reductase transmembrane component 7 [Fulvia fulva]|uniref:Ferric/cupric reductase transmembrane component 7 n=1 Tax=Passalora fulva TaxID=5499 RepID=A0A9Q8PHQ0_PASFU|nr:Ferric/cupric reductase transmembrane component 7 [Fulvia fulva]KAK4626110.1 Ferric/cupric reductase transmembrane component 7 [Fulvia fulva]KAK4628020.1 Ferric/cupric reductase transmembrane component 7 [Fulvia fulva]UJO22859.1 Ferric/cupric reductase transmembrane component 7 [Fulvia fulva]WPV13101.1 Ferric/cupric reductase transmembrane component 7 [Fulvia fulva]WPV28255.1 Ferric/cupric reductase transmembrane component 7 [Fulvia fulva]
MVAHRGHDAEMSMDSDTDMSGMDMGGSSSSMPLNTTGIDFSNRTEALEFLDDLLDDTELKKVGNDYAKYFWYGAIVLIALATIFNFLRWVTLQHRLREAARRREHPAKPKSTLARCLATITATGREAIYLQFSPTTPLFKVPPLGSVTLLLVYLAFVLALEFGNNTVAGAQYWQALGVRAGWLAVAQMPLLVLLTGKNNILGVLTGVSYERLNIIHRWSARMMLLLAVFHFAFQSNGWQKYGVMRLEWQTDDCPTTGIAAFAILLWTNLSTLAPVRCFNYEFFVIQHVLSFIGFVVAILLHLSSTAPISRVYIFIPIGIYLLDRTLRTIMLAYNNFRGNRASLTQLQGGVTKVRISNTTIKSWRAGSHVLLSIPKFGLLQSHPATIVSIPRSHNGDLVFILKSHKGFTKRIMEGASSSTEALVSSDKTDGDAAEEHAQIIAHTAFIEGPYGASHSDFAAFDSVCLVAGSTGVTFTIAVLQDIADRATRSGKRLPVRRIHFVWCIKDTDWASWISSEIISAYNKLHSVGIEVEVSIYVTCADNFTNPSTNDNKECGCECDKSKGPCCCVQVDEDEKGEDVEDVDIIAPVSKGKQAVRVRDLSGSSVEAGNSMPGRRMPVLPCGVFYSGRPQIKQVLAALLDGADGESGVAACGPLGLTSEVRNTIVHLSDERAIHKGTGAQGCYLHVEGAS